MFFLHRNYVLSQQGDAPSTSQVAHSPVLQNAAINARDMAGDESCCPARMSQARTAVPGTLGEGRTRIWGWCFIESRAQLGSWSRSIFSCQDASAYHGDGISPTKPQLSWQAGACRSCQVLLKSGSSGNGRDTGSL